MIVAIDETGTFGEASDRRHFFVAAHLRQRKTLYDQKARQFESWESGLDRSLKNPRGEIKSSVLSDDQLEEFARRVVTSNPYVRVTSLTICPSANPKEVVDKHQVVYVASTREAVKWYEQHDRPGPAQIFNDLANWLGNLNYQQFLKVLLLCDCITNSFVNTVGHSTSGNYEEELTRIGFKIDRDFIRQPRTETFWRQMLRTSLWWRTQINPVPILERWRRKSHPGHRFLEKYRAEGFFDFNDLFEHHCEFVTSHEHFEVRIADGIGTIFSRFHNDGRCKRAYDLLRHCICASGHVPEYVLRDFNLSEWRYDPAKNPYLSDAEPDDSDLVQT